MSYQYPVHEVSILNLFRNGLDTHHIAQMRHMEESEVLRVLTRQRTRDLALKKGKKTPKARGYQASWVAA